MSHPASLIIAIALAASTAPAFAQAQDIDKVNGSITAEAGRQYGSLETVNGSIRIGAGARTGGAETVNGSIKVEDRASTGKLETVNGGVRVGRAVQVAGGIETVNGSVFVDRGGRLQSVETVNGAIGLVDSDLSGGIETVNGDVTVGMGSHVRGGLAVRKPNNGWMPVKFGRQRVPRIVIGPGAVVEGPLVFEREVKLYVHTSARTGRISGATPIAYDSPVAPKD